MQAASIARAIPHPIDQLPLVSVADPNQAHPFANANLARRRERIDGNFDLLSERIDTFRLPRRVAKSGRRALLSERWSHEGIGVGVTIVVERSRKCIVPSPKTFAHPGCVSPPSQPNTKNRHQHQQSPQAKPKPATGCGSNHDSILAHPGDFRNSITPIRNVSEALRRTAVRSYGTADVKPRMAAQAHGQSRLTTYPWVRAAIRGTTQPQKTPAFSVSTAPFCHSALSLK
jgi:hypothetical protein